MTTEERIAALEAQVEELSRALTRLENQVLVNRARIEDNIKHVEEGLEHIENAHSRMNQFNAKINDPNAESGQIAWNSFGYKYQVPLFRDGVENESNSIYLEAQPLKVGLKYPNAPILKKVLTLLDLKILLMGLYLQDLKLKVMKYGKKSKKENSKVSHLKDSSMLKKLMTLKNKNIMKFLI